MTPSSSAGTAAVLRDRVRRLPARYRWLAVAAVALAILYFSVVKPPAPPGPPGPADPGTVLHVLAYGGLASTLAYAVAADRPYGAAAVALVLAGSVGYGLAMELLQTMLPPRTFDVADLLANAVGSGLVVPLWALLDARGG